MQPIRHAGHYSSAITLIAEIIVMSLGSVVDSRPPWGVQGGLPVGFPRWLENPILVVSGSDWSKIGRP